MMGHQPESDKPRAERLADRLNRIARDRHAADRLLEDLDRAWADHGNGDRLEFATAYIRERGLELTASEWDDVQVWAAS